MIRNSDTTIDSMHFKCYETFKDERTNITMIRCLLGMEQEGGFTNQYEEQTEAMKRCYLEGEGIISKGWRVIITKRTNNEILKVYSADKKPNRAGGIP